MYYSKNNGWKPWWEKVGELDSAQEREEFMRGVSGMGLSKSVLTGIIVGVVGTNIVKSAIDKRKK